MPLRPPSLARWSARCRWSVGLTDAEFATISRIVSAGELALGHDSRTAARPTSRPGGLEPAPLPLLVEVLFARCEVVTSGLVAGNPARSCD